MERHFDRELEALKRQLLKMCASAENMIVEATRALVDRDPAMIPPVLQRERQVDRMQVEIDEACLTLIALHQPAASDLRFILGAAKTNAELERLADQAVNITRKASRLMREPPLPESSDLSAMAAHAREMLRDSLHAYVNRDVLKAREVIAGDDVLDEMKRTLTGRMLEAMQRDPALIRRAVDVLLVTRNLERIGDHATNIAENAIFVAEGRDVRHGGPAKPDACP
jgi:phosphate transport system protein